VLGSSRSATYSGWEQKIDNLRAAVKKVDWFEPELNPKVVSFCEHYGTVILPTKPAMPRHKGKVEAGVKYVQDNGLAGKQFVGLGAQNVHLAHWEETVADTRIHGTTRQQVRTHFLTIGKPRLLPLPASLFPVFSEAPRQVHRDGYVEVDKAYYSVPPEYVRRKVWARWDTKMVRLFNERMEGIAVHVWQEPGRFKTDPAHIHDHKRTLIERGAEWILDRCRLLGSGAGTWAESLYQQRGPESLRVLQGLLALAEKHPAPQLDQACHLALTHEEFLEILLQDELNVRKERLLSRRTKAADFHRLKTLEDFDWRFNPGIPRKQIYDLATGQFIRQAADLLFIGSPGVGKTHLAQALGYEAIKLNFQVLYRSIFDLVRDFLKLTFWR
jgi:hypothetical protein